MVGQRGLLQDSQEDRYYVSLRECATTVNFVLNAPSPTHTHSDLSQRLNMSAEDGEKWIVNLIRDSKMGIDAKIDLQAVSSGGRIGSIWFIASLVLITNVSRLL
jgi:hypothetical protein